MRYCYFNDILNTSTAPNGDCQRGSWNKESKEQAIVREIKEETGLTMSEYDLSYREVLFVSYRGKDFLYHVFNTSLTEKPDVSISPPEHKQYGWFTIEQALSLDLIHDLDACIERHYGSVLHPVAVQ